MLRVLVFSYFILCISYCYGNDDLREHHHAVELARQGHYDEAFSIFDYIIRSKGWYEQLVYDYMSVLTWQGRHKESYSLFRKRVTEPIVHLPLYVIEVLARNCRELEYTHQARFFYSFLLQKKPGDIDGYIGLAFVLFQENNPYEIPNLLLRFKDDPHKGVEVLNLIALSYMRMGFYVDALKHYEEALEKIPTDKEAIQGRAKALNEALASYEAEKFKDKKARNILMLHSQEHMGIYEQYRDQEDKTQILGKDLLEKIKSNQAALDIKWGIASEYPENYSHFDRAIDKLTDQASQKKDERQILNNLCDLLIVYNRRGRHEDTLRLYEKLLLQGKSNEDIPLQSLEAVGDSYLTLRFLREAKTIFSFVLRKSPSSIDSIKGIYYTLLENEELKSSLTFIKNQRGAQEKLTTISGMKRSNESRQNLEECYHASFLYANLLSKSEEKLRDIIKIAPYNTQFRRLLGETYLARGLPRAAKKEFDIGQTNNKENLGLKVSRVGALMSLSQYEEAEKLLEMLKSSYPSDESIKKLEKSWNAYNSMEIESRYSFEKGGLSSKGTSSLEGSFYSRPIAYNFRAFLVGRYLTGEFPEGSLSYVSKGAGVQYTSTSLNTTMAFHSDHYAGHSQVGTKLVLNCTPSDEWSFSGVVDLHSLETPGRALANKISSHYFQIGAGYYYNNALKFGVSFFDQEFTGRNAWQGGSTYIQGQLVERPRETTDLRIDLGWRKSKINDVPYYSPLKDSYVSVSPIFNQTLYRHYEFSFKHSLTPALGLYWEKGYRRAWVFGVSYEHILDYQNWYYLSYGIRRKRSTYDGVHEYSTTLFANFNIRF